MPPEAHPLSVSPYPCSLCPDAGLMVKTEGNATHNTVCQCRAGMHCSDASCQTCLENLPCQRGFGFVAGGSGQLVPLSRTGALAALILDPSGKGGLHHQGAPGRALGDLGCPCAQHHCHRECCLPDPLTRGEGHPAACTHLPVTSASLQPRPWPGCPLPVSPVQRALSPTSPLKQSPATPGQGTV